MDHDTQFRQARELFQAGRLEEAEALVARLLREDPRDTKVLSFRAYLLYRRGLMDDAVAAYRRLAELEPRTAAHFSNLGLICFKEQRYLEARGAFEKLRELQPQDAKVLKNLGMCHERLGDLEKALDCFARAGDAALVEKIRSRLSRAAPATGAGAEVPSRERPPHQPEPAVVSGRQDLGMPPRAPAPPTEDEPEILEWLERRSLARGGDGPELARAGAGELLLELREKIHVNPAFCAAHRGIVVFAAASRAAEKAAGKFGDKRGLLSRAEGNGELLLSGGDRRLLTFHLAGGRVYVNYPALACCGAEVAAEFLTDAMIKGGFLPVELAGSGRVVLAVRGNPVVLPVHTDLPVLARPQAVIAWTDSLMSEGETVPELRKLVGKDEALRCRFEGSGYLLLQSC